VRWFFVPFKDYSNDPTMPGNAKRYRDKYGKDDVRVVTLGDDLRDVKAGDMLIVAGHGLPGDDRLGVTVAELSWEVNKHVIAVREDTITANDLAEKLDKQDLPHDHVFVKTISCGGAGMGVLDHENQWRNKLFPLGHSPLKELKYADCFASVLAKALAKRGYERILVAGYPGFVDATVPQKIVTLESDSPQAVDHPDWKEGKTFGVHARYVDQIWFDGKGARWNASNADIKLYKFKVRTFG